MHRRNEETFAKCHALLNSGNVVALFPEGTTHVEPMMMPARTGAARIALSAAESSDWRAPQIIPVGLWYENSTRFRSTVLVVPGKPVEIAAFRHRFTETPREAVHELTALLEEGLHAVVLEAETTELLKSAPFIAAWTQPDGHKPDLKARQAWAAELLDGYRKMRKADPGRLASIEGAVRQYARMLDTLGVKGPVEAGRAQTGGVVCPEARAIAVDLVTAGTVRGSLELRALPPCSQCRSTQLFIQPIAGWSA